MMTNFDIKFDVDHDMHLDGADIAFADDDDIIKQRLTIRLQFLLEEWFLDNRVGLPYTQIIFEQGTDLKDVYSLFRDEILNTEGVEDIVTLELTPTTEDKILRVDFSVNSGSVTDSVEVTV